MAALSGPPGALIAWDPVPQKERWRIRQAGGFNGGLLATASGLLFQGAARPAPSLPSTARAASSSGLSPRRPASLAAPITFTAGGEQYVAVLAGVGTSRPVAPGAERRAEHRPFDGVQDRRQGHRIAARAADTAGRHQSTHRDPATGGTWSTRARYQFMVHCAFCHMARTAWSGRTFAPSATLADGRAWNAVVGEGALAKRGMVGWSSVMTPDEIQSIRAYFIGEAQAYKGSARQGAAGRWRESSRDQAGESDQAPFET